MGRKNDYSVVNGKQIYNFDIERAILTSDKVKLCEVQTHPNDENKLVAHIVWENEVNSLFERSPEKQMEYFKDIQELTMRIMNMPEAVPYSFCVRDSFPSAHSGKRDIQYIKGNIEGIIDTSKP